MMGANKHEFKVGDKVRVVKEGEYGSYHCAKIGEVFEVTKIYDTGQTEIHTDVWYFYPDEIEPVAVAASNDAATPAKFKVGDRLDGGQGGQ